MPSQCGLLAAIARLWAAPDDNRVSTVQANHLLHNEVLGFYPRDLSGSSTCDIGQWPFILHSRYWAGIPTEVSFKDVDWRPIWATRVCWPSAQPNCTAQFAIKQGARNAREGIDSGRIALSPRESTSTRHFSDQSATSLPPRRN